MKLYGSATSPYVRKVRAFALERGAPVTFIVEDPWAKSERLLAMNPLGKVPVLVLDNGETVFDSFAVIDCVDELAGGERMIPASGAARRDALRWHSIAQGLIDAVVVRLLETRRPAHFAMPDKMAREEERVAAALRYIETGAHLEPPAIKDKLDFDQIMIGVATRYMDFRYPHDWKSSHPRLAQFAQAISQRSSFQLTEPPT